MATKPPTDAAQAKFLAALLAPLPEGEEPVASKRFVADLRRDEARVWDKAMELVEIAKHCHALSALAVRRCNQHPASELLMTVNLENYAALCRAEQRQCLVPAPTLKELRWKRRRMGGWGKVDDPLAVNAAIAADEARLAGKEALS